MEIDGISIAIVPVRSRLFLVVIDKKYMDSIAYDYRQLRSLRFISTLLLQTGR